MRAERAGDQGKWERVWRRGGPLCGKYGTLEEKGVNVMIRCVCFLFIFVVLGASWLLPAASLGALLNAEQIIAQVEENLNGKSAIMKISMTVQTKRSQRTMKMESYTVGTRKSFIRIDYPKKDQGITFLKVESQMWQYVPRIEKIIKIPASMMMQSWMGSDFTNDDLVRESSIRDDYQKRVVSEDAAGWTVELLPKEDAAVVWGRIAMTVSRELLLPTTVDYFDEEGVLVRVLSYEAVKRFGARNYPSRWRVEPRTADKLGHQTVIEVEDVVFDQEISDDYFTKRALKRFSQ